MRIVMRIADNCPQEIKAFTDDAKAFEYLEDLLTEYVSDFYLSDEEREQILDGIHYEYEINDSSLVTMSYVTPDK